MWVKIEVIPSDSELLYLPVNFKSSLKQTVEIKFGKRAVKTSVRFTRELRYNNNSTFEKPITIRITDKLRDKSLIQESLIYQFKIKENNIIVGPVIGLLLGIHTHRYNPRHMSKYSDRMGIYNKIGGLVYAFSPKLINWKKQTAYGLFYNKAAASWQYGCFPLPEIIYRRDFHSNPRIIKKLIEYTDGKFFNSYRFTKFELNNYISLNAELRKHLPPTEMSQDFDQVNKFIDIYKKVILKPTDLSRGRGICIIEKAENYYRIIDYRYKTPVTTVLYNKRALEKFFEINRCFFNKYLIQKFLPLSRIGNSLFDIRVVMQKKSEAEWVCSGIECRVSSKNCHITNISRGGYALTLNEALNQSFASGQELIIKRINEFCQKFCKYMDEFGENFAEFGIDIAIDVNRHLWLIEANVFPSFKGFKSIDRQTYLKIRYTPMLYALSLTEFGSENKKE